MKILQINKYLYPKGGADKYCLELGRELIKKGHSVEFFGMEDEKNEAINSLGLYTKNLDFHSRGIATLTYPFKIIYSAEARKKLGKVLDDFKPDIVHMSNINYQLTPSIIDEIYAHGIPMVMTVHDSQLVCPCHMLFNAQTESLCEKCTEGSVINCIKGRCIHNSLPKSIIGAAEGGLYRLHDTYSKVDRYICPSKFMAKMVSRNKYVRGRTEVVCNFVPDNSPELYNKKEYIIYFGRLSPEKGIDLIAEAAKKLPEIEFVIAGTGPSAKLLDGIPNVSMVGFKRGKELERLVGEALLNLVPTTMHENCPLSVLEAHALATPSICTFLGGVPELIRDGETGAVMQEMTAECLCENIKSLYYDREKLERMVKNCIESRKGLYTISEYVNKMLDIYAELTRQESPVQR